jgi:hypothetical protein
MQTSIEWFIEHLLGNGLLRLTKEEHKLYSELRDKAKEMHLHEIINAHNSGFDKSSEGWNGEYGLMDMNNISEEIGSEQYYKETFKKD